ncbi:MAG: electron transfer flavoprotein subunit alpha/FixB family protein [Deltaproteobacteria bacterium]|nr:electron transfer flavoprotein subunit alpha/FixB family protein [Deltaproteobacteria bacterium]
MSQVHLIVAEYDSNHLKKACLSAITAAQKVGGTCHGLVLGKGVKHFADAFAKYVDTVHYAEHDALEHRLAQPDAKVIADVAKSAGATHVWAAATVNGKDVMPRVAVRLEAAMASDISSVVNEKTYQRPMWAGDITGTVELHTPVQVITVRPTEFAPAEQKAAGQIQSVSVDPGDVQMKFVGFDEVKSERPELTEASIVVSGGRGVKSPEGFKKLIEPLADHLNAAIGASRAVCDAGWVPNDWQVGQTGKVVAPKLYFAIGISGAIQHVAGMKGSKCIVAINKDPEAPIFQVADYGLVGDAATLVPELIEKLKAL